MPILTAREYAWDQTEAADAFIASAESRQTSVEVMRTIAKLANDTDEANAIWELICRSRRPTE